MPTPYGTPGYVQYPMVAPVYPQQRMPQPLMVPQGGGVIPVSTPGATARAASKPASAEKDSAATKLVAAQDATPEMVVPASDSPAVETLPSGDSYDGFMTPFNYRSILGDPEDETTDELGFFRVDYLMGWFKSAPSRIPLVTTGSAADAPAGGLGSPNTQVLFGRGNIDFNLAQGFRLELGSWLTSDQHYGWSASGFYFLPQRVDFRATSDANGSPVITRPTTNAIDGTENTYLVSVPGIAAGSALVSARTTLYGWDINVYQHHCVSKNLSWDGILGFRVLHLNERLFFRDQFTALRDNVLSFRGLPVPAGSSFVDEDDFDTANNFYGVQLGGKARWKTERLYVDLIGKVALGATGRRVSIDGSTVFTNNGVSTFATGGILAQSTNIGSRREVNFSAVPEFGLNTGWAILENVRLTVGYSVLVWSGVARPGDQIDRVVNPSLVPTDQNFGAPAGPNLRPTFTLRDQTFFVHNFNFGLELHY